MDTAARPKLEVSLMPHHLSIRYSKEDSTDDNCLDNLSKWSHFVLEAMVTIVERKAAVAQVYTSDGDFEFPDTLTSKTWKCKKPDATYYLASADSWTKEEIVELSSLMEFDLSSLWFQLMNGPKVEETLIDVVTFYNVIEQVLVGDELEGYGFQAIGNVCDGEEILWLNPNWSEVERVMPHLKGICTKQGLDWHVVDQRKKE